MNTSSAKEEVLPCTGRLLLFYMNVVPYIKFELHRQGIPTLASNSNRENMPPVYGSEEDGQRSPEG
jgi:hypothetical protein